MNNSNLSSKAVPLNGEITAKVTALTDDAKGVVRIDNKVIFVDGTLPGEEIVFRVAKRRRRYDRATLVEIVTPSLQRVAPPCEYFGYCGGCGLQHLEPGAQIVSKEQILREQFNKFGVGEPEKWLLPLVGDNLHYRRKARLGVKYVYKKNSVLVGFRERASAYLADMNSCQTLDTRFSQLIPALREFIMELSCKGSIPQIEVAAGDDQLALVFRHLEPLSSDDESRLTAFAQQYQVQLYLQAGGPETVTLFWPEHAPTMSYSLPDYSLEMLFRATDFIQVNADMNKRMIDRALQLLEIKPDDCLLDLFCGLGNFTLPIARFASRVVGVEANTSLIDHARINAKHNGIQNAEFRLADLYDENATLCWDVTEFNKLLLDPPRNGAMHVIKQLPKKNGPERIVYVSCNPVTLARDSEYLVNEKKYSLIAAGVMDMFPHTNHVESIAVFER